MSNNIIGERIALCLQNHQMKQVDLAKKLGIHPHMISFYVNGDRVPKIERLIEMSKIFGVTVDYLIGNTDTPTMDNDIRLICDYTGLSSDFVEMLHEHNDTIELEKLVKSEFIRDLFSDTPENKEIFNDILQAIKSAYAINKMDKLTLREKRHTGENEWIDILYSLYESKISNFTDIATDNLYTFIIHNIDKWSANIYKKSNGKAFNEIDNIIKNNLKIDL